MKIGITGALGHIGSRLIRDLPNAFPNSEIVMIDNMSTQRYASLFNLPKSVKYRFIECDVMHDDLVSVFSGVDVVVHLAAITNAAGSFEMKQKVEYENYHATKLVASACLETGSALIHLSSTSVYGTQDEVIDENCSESELAPQSPYAETKIREENLIKQMTIESGLPAVICRFGTIFGTSPGMRFHTAVNKFCWQAVMKQPLTVWSTAYEQKRPYLDLNDAVQAIVFIINNKLFDGEIYNVLTSNLTVKDVVETIKQNVSDLKIEFVDAEIMNQLSYNVLCKKFTQLGFNFTGSLKSSIADTVNLIRNSMSFYEN